MTSEQASVRAQRLGERNAAALSLARLLSFAALAEPALIRRMRLDLLPASSAADEADLWFSNLVQSRSPGGLVFFPEVAEILRQGLAPELRREAWERTRQIHRGARRAIQIEEELTYLGLDAEINRARIDELLREVISAMIGGRSELANWAGRALPRLPSTVQNLESAAVLRIAAELRLGRKPDLRTRLAAVGRMPTWIAAALPLLPRVRLGVTLVNNEISLGPLPPDPQAQLHSIEVPDTPTVCVEVRWTAPEGPRSKILFVEKGETSQPESVDAGPIELVTLANETWTLQPTGTLRDEQRAKPLTLSAYTDGYVVTLHWRSREKIPGCLGFAVMRRRRSGKGGDTPETEKVLRSRGGVAPSTEDPYQRFDWIDRPAPRDEEFSYRVVPMAGQPGKLRPMEALFSAWTPFIRVGPQTDAPISVAFNRTFESAASLGLSADDIGQLSRQGFHDVIAQPGNRVRQALGGDLLSSLTALLLQTELGSHTVYAAMFELDDPEILHLLEKLGKRANIVLSNGAARPRNPDSNREARLRLKDSKVGVFDRMFSSGRLAHNKFLVVCDSEGRPSKVWTGNVGWTSVAICARSNVSVTVNSPQVAADYLSYWRRLASSLGTRALAAANSVDFPPVAVGRAMVRPWFTPVLKRADIESAAKFILNARQGILFMLSEPGRTESLVRTIFEQENLYVMGAMRSGSAVTLYRNRKQTRVSGRQLSSPLLDLAERIKAPTLTLQSRMIVIDPLGSHPVVLIGSHAFGARGSRNNDENFLIIENDPEVARRCAAHIDAYCQHYRSRAAAAAAAGSLALHPGDEWQEFLLQPDAQGEIAFWMAEDARTFAAPAPAADAPELKHKPAKAVRPSKTVRRKSLKAAAKKAPAKPAARKAPLKVTAKAKSRAVSPKRSTKAKARTSRRLNRSKKKR